MAAAHMGTVYQALAENELDLRSRDAYVAGPAKTVAAVVEVLLKKGMSSTISLSTLMGCEQEKRGGGDKYLPLHTSL
jgi:NAD(P)H-flavin reductase